MMIDDTISNLTDGKNILKKNPRIKDAVLSTVKRMAITLSAKNTRSSFFSALSKEIAKIYPFDRLSINLYDSENEVLCIFTSAEGTVVSALSTLREANANTVAGRVISTRKPVVISNLLAQFHGELAQPMTEAGLNCTVAFPLIENQEIIGTLHCSFVEEPNFFMELIDFFAELVPFITVFLSHVLTKELLNQTKTFPAPVHLPGALAKQDLMLFGSENMQELMTHAKAVAALNIPVLITGETGTGKTLLARYLHNNSPRSEHNFVKVNCPSIAPNLIESELFGHVKGAFTGANMNRIGRIEFSQNGTLFLDEVAELPIEMQSKFLQVLEEKAFERVGENIQTRSDFRLISATNQNINQAISNNKLRQDFYYRLSTITIHLPPLRERIEDIPLLFEHLANIQANQLGLPQISLSSKLMDILKAHKWVGNIRELRNVTNRLLIQNTRSKITIENLQEILNDNVSNTQKAQPTTPQAENTKNNTEQIEYRQEKNDSNDFQSLEQIERNHIIKTLKSCEGILSGTDGAAKKLGLPRTTLQNKMRKLGIAKEDYS
ncbi:sigma-54 interaction domain-containing protein [Desulfovibrio litoralis]|uniref:DNA-binding transcriptional response regulator, NtrC family, contains REC, AAA-type ATPase, and a Fis-type DNA-binding domains n=1 Tax=Desulfovibrio litoralis DSM 11393 TaxID=1121455 RepID=A0A1M7T3R8_9BACT|nr:sigma-54-dependent Fis family transcriptional regulator [Desulfovibrio litoralis]SHN65302.1 DNA-binding transcriptional response regulator, NtrC family, contains REC, AAA-type ATPase, and a Fis-type DNA-binding domains [Desulfovibrio litoralis DSM 11393]